MSWAELRVRGRQEIFKRWDLMLYFSGSSFELAKNDGQKSSTGRFFFSCDDLAAIGQILCENLPEEVRNTVEQAQRICWHRFDLLGYKDLDYGPRIDWHLDVVHGKRAPLKPWFTIRYLDFGTVGDAKIIWELNRHQHLVTLAKAYQLTHKARFASEVARQWYAWRQDNPYPLGINWASSLEVAFRSLSWLWVLHLLAGARDMSALFRTDLLRGLAINGRHIEHYLSTYFSPNTHLLGEGVALFFIGTLCPELAAAPRWKQLGWQTVLREAERQVQPDGTHFEQSVYYHVYALDFFLHARILAACNDVPIPASFDLTIERMLDALLLLSKAGNVPRLGDDDGGRVFNPRRNQAEHMTDPLCTGAILFERPDFKSVVSDLREESLWLLGPKGVTRFEQFQPCEPLAASTRLKSSGICIMASSGRRREKLVIAGGPMGHGTAGHGHADLLSLELIANGRQWLVDPGTRCYLSEGHERNRFRGTAAHNTLQVDGLDQAEPSRPFAWKSLPRVDIEHWVVGQTFNFFSGKHDGYHRLPHPVTHRRSVFHLKDQFWLVHDRAEGDGIHRLALNWHMGLGVKPASVNPERVVFSADGGDTLALLPVHGQKWQHRIYRSEVSKAYGYSEPSFSLSYSTKTLLPTEFATLMLHFEEADFKESRIGSFTRLQPKSEDKNISGYLYEQVEERHSIFIARGPHTWSMSCWTSDADLFYCGISRKYGLHLALSGGSFVRWNGKPLLTCAARLERWESLAGKARRGEFCSDEAIPREVNKSALSDLETLQVDAVAMKGAG